MKRSIIALNRAANQAKKSLLISLLIATCFGLQAQDVTPAKDGDKYSLSTGDMFFEVDANVGGQVSSYKIGGDELLYYGGGDNQGSTFWPSPQSVWGWPPSTELDNDPYAAEISGNSVIMQGDTDPDSKLKFKKTFTANSSTKKVKIVYEIINTRSSDAYSVAGWEVTRVPTAGGLSFFPIGSGDVWGNGNQDFSSYTEQENGIVWYEANASHPSGKKFFCDGSEGWIAHVNKDGYLFVKTFDDVPGNDVAPGEDEIEFWHSSATSYVELENQSAYEEIPAEGSLSYTVEWYAEELSGDIEVSVGSTELLDRVREIAGIVSAEEYVDTDMIQVYPNPASDYISLRSAKAEGIDLRIFDITGKEMMSFIGKNNGSYLDISELNSGIYLYTVKSGDKLDTGKLLIK